jgi:hypothetical protein
MLALPTVIVGVAISQLGAVAKDFAAALFAVTVFAVMAALIAKLALWLWKWRSGRTHAT